MRLILKGQRRSTQRVGENRRVIDVKRRIALGDGLRLTPTSDFEIQQLQKAIAEKRVTEGPNLIKSTESFVRSKMA